jgi:hypothetical protein
MSAAPQTPPTSTATTSGSAASASAGSVSGSAGTKDRVNNAYTSTFGIPTGIKLEQFDGSDWANWSGIMEVILTLHEADDLLRFRSAPTNVPTIEWESVQRRVKAYLRLYIKPDVYSLIASATDLPTFKDKWDKLKDTYGGASGRTTAINLWRQLTQATLDDSIPMAQQLAKINETREALSNASMGITDNQFCLILLHALPNSYEVLALTILASGGPDKLKHSEIIAQILNEEGRRSGSSSSLNAAKAAPIKSAKGKKRDHSNLTCHYCNKKGHIKPNCHKKK